MLSKLTLLKRIANLAAVFAAGLFDCQQRHRDRVIGLGVIGVGNLAVCLLNLADEFLRGRNVRGGRAAVVGHVEHAIDRIAAEFDIFRQRDAVAAKARQRHVHLHELLGDQRALGVARPFDQHLSGTGFDAPELSGKVQIAARIALLSDDFEAIFLPASLERLKATTSEIVIDIEERYLCDVWKFLVDERRKIAGQLGVRDGRTKHPFVSLRGDFLRGSGHDDLRRLRLRGDLRRGKACRATDAADHDRNIVARGQALGDIDRFFRFAGVVCIDRFDLLAANSAGGILILDCKIDGFFFCGTGSGGVAGKRSEHSDLDRVGRCPDGRADHQYGGEQPSS